MPDDAVSSVPDRKTCPLCGGPNHCGMSRDLTKSAWICWCAYEKFPAELLARIPEAARKKTCVCPDCVRNFKP